MLLHRKEIPTNDTLMPPDVSRAKLIRYLMTKRAEMSDAEYAAVVANETFGEALGDGDEGNGEEFSNEAAPVHIPSSFNSSDELTQRVVTLVSQYDLASTNR